MDGEMDVDLMTLRILSRSGFYDGEEDQEHFWTEMHYYRDHCRGDVECQDRENDGVPTVFPDSLNDLHEGADLKEFFACWDYWNRLESL